MVVKVEEQLVYRHLIVARKGSMALTAPPEQLRKLHRQLQEVDEGAREAVDSDLVHLLKRTHLRKTLKQVYGESYSDESIQGTSRRQGGAIVVATLHKEKIPGGTEPLPQTATFWTQPAPYNDTPPFDAFAQAAEKLRERFKIHSDAKIRLLDPAMQRNVTLVTVAYAPMSAYAHPNRDSGFEVGMEFIQKTRFGRVDANTFEVYSETGEYPIKPPSTEFMGMLMKTVEELGDYDRGFLTDEEREQVKKDRIAARARRNIQ